MRTGRFTGLFFLLLLFLAAEHAAAQLPAIPAAGQNAGTQIGVAAGVNGPVTLEAPGRAGRIVESGQAVRIGDEITTGENGRLQILLLDETVFTIGPSTTLVIDEFVYDPASGEGNIQAQVMKGIFRFISGKIAKKNPANVKVLLPTGSVGVRGTIFYGKVEGQASTVLLLGPGEKNNTGHRAGRIVVQNGVEGKQNSVEVTKSGFGSEIRGPGVPPSQPFRFSQEQIAEMTAPLLPSGEAEEEGPNGAAQTQAGQTQGGRPAAGADTAGGPLGGEDSSASELAGQGAFESLNDASDFKTIESFGENLAKESAEAAQEAADDSLETFGDITTVDQLRSIQTGIVHFEGMNFPLFDGTGQNGDFDVKLDINFGTREIGGGNSKIRVQSSPINGGSSTFISLGTQNYSALQSGPAAFHYSFGTSSIVSCSTCTADVVVAFTNEQDAIANRASVTLAIENGTELAGTGITGPRNDGAAQAFI